MKSKYLKIAAYISYSLSFLIFGVYIYQEISTSFMVPTLFKLLYTIGSGIYCFFGSIILSKVYKKQKSKIKKLTLIFLFIEYIILLLILTLFDPSFGRGLSNIFNSSNQSAIKYLKEHTNFIPFKTIIEYIKLQNVKFILINIFGNIIAFMPLGLFLPLIFGKINTVLKFVVYVTSFILFIEIIQIILLTGSFDIDDLILNLSGALIIYGLFGFYKNKEVLWKDTKK